MSKIYTAIGLMSGTSMDGVDAAVLRTDGNGVAMGTAKTMFRPYGSEEHALLEKTILDVKVMFGKYAANSQTGKTGGPAKGSAELSKFLFGLETAQDMITSAHEGVISHLLIEHQIDSTSIDVIGFHGQTVLHRPEQRFTLQLGYGQKLADSLGIPVVDDFRSADVDIGGQGAPLVPIYHQALVKRAGLELPVAVLNVGGVANVTYIGADGELLAFDTGPGNALINDWVNQHGAGDMDKGGEIAAQGRVKESVLAALLNNPYFSQDPPKSLDRNYFSLAPLQEMSLEGGAMTLTSFTALAASRAVSFFPSPPKKWIICGGGVHNSTLMTEFQKRLSGEVLSADDLGWSSDYMEAEAFAYLAVRSMRGLPLTFPGTTGICEPQTGGVLHKPQG